jgi:hypothetical protein
MTDRADGFLPREEIPDRRSSSTLVARGKNARMMRPARVSCGPGAANGLPLMPSASARTDCASSWHGSSSAIAPELTGYGLSLSKCEAYNSHAVRPGMPATPGRPCRKNLQGSSTVSFMTIALLTGKQSIWHPACGPPRPQ